jgi:shikimate dehydrogenase
MHNAAFQAAGLDYVYLAFDVTDVGACLAGMRAFSGFRGLSVTIPHKTAVMPYLDEIDPMARVVGCVNTVTNGQGRLVGSVTDGTGTLRAFAGAAVPLEGQRILFLGAGGAVRAVAYAMALQAKPACVTILARNPAKAAALADDLRRDASVAIGAGDLALGLSQHLDSHDIVIHGTPIGMHGHDEGRSPVPQKLLRPRHVVFDMVYRPRLTPLLKEAAEVGCRTIPGSDMLLQQAVIQFETWTGVPAPVDPMRRALQAALGAPPPPPAAP